ncbi:hypothetical protein CYMTET_20208 [Cymbomonas tetramitiformis]|uniref:Uncharacterized protein n=1 Tax=Cymbomonas tetramitiformis TaxID=36881 RepID=A0AAE0L449_9CHLO|nr:hypothetical protein CYMTET_20208 [Cymbomonas tetramitiformis]
MNDGNVWKGFAAGSMAAMVSGAVTHPIDLVKVRMQLDPSAGKSGMLKTGYSVIRNEGVLAIYKGLTASLLRQASFIGTKFGSYDVFKKILQDESGKISFGAKAACGFGAGAAGAIVGNPADLAMVRMQADGKLPVEMRRNYKNAFDAIHRIITEEGVMTLWRGSSPTVSRAMIITASQLAVYDQIKEELLKFGMEMRSGCFVLWAAAKVSSGARSREQLLQRSPRSPGTGRLLRTEPGRLP